VLNLLSAEVERHPAIQGQADTRSISLAHHQHQLWLYMAYTIRNQSGLTTCLHDTLESVAACPTSPRSISSISTIVRCPVSDSFQCR
jgi:hypothetical protein